ncbi:hypothetical protein PsorP6_003343 [Peronosclerospora sorghi]|uniref:Uncharacterized protein n=1 Tax=Peronosclerospora sorghi TaxID=230839 RepID=A0ACC0VN66_9STRA|nr:hypothetical protein PsorP6_003343 [Peronosclerospora sorghi]
MVPFEFTIKSIQHSTPCNIRYDYNEARYAAQFRLLLDGIRDEIKNHREANLVGGNSRRMANNTSDIRCGENLGDWDPTTLYHIDFAFIYHGDHHHAFVKRLHDRLVNNAVKSNGCTQSYTDAKECIHAAEEAILNPQMVQIDINKGGGDNH